MKRYEYKVIDTGRQVEERLNELGAQGWQVVGVTTKKQDLEALKQPPNPDVKLTAYDVDDMNVRLYDKTAVVTGRVTTKRLVKGQAMTSQSRFTDVFVWRDGRWQLVAGHSSRIRTPS